MAAKRGLGKGLDSLIVPKVPSQATGSRTASEEALSDRDRVMEVSVDDVEPNRSQPRKHFDDGSLQELADSIAQYGVLQPLLVRRRDDYYEIIAGERRWRAAKKAGCRTVPVLVREVSDRERSEIALIENLQREDLDPIEEASAYRQLIDDYGLRQEEVAECVSKSRSSITNSMRLLKLDERVQEMLQTQQISVGHARALLAVKSSERQLQIARQAAEKGLSVRDVEKLVQTEKAGGGRREKPDKKKKKDLQQEAIYQKITDQLCERLGTRVRILDEDGKGRIEISYYSPEELERILELIRS